MPEGDTIHRAALRIGAALAGTVPDEVQTPHPRHRFDRWPERLAGRQLLGTEARGKHLLIRFEGGLVLHSHLRMTGAWGVTRTGERWRRARSRAWLVMRGGGFDVVQFDGPVLELLTDVRARSLPQLSRLGPDVLGERFDAGAFLRRMHEDDPTRSLGDALLDQRIVAGLGNLWKSEACFACRADPWRPIGEVTDEQALALVRWARERMLEAVRGGVGARPAAVYRRAGMPCPRCGGTIRSRGQGDNNRLTFWCPACQR
ncbi:MAG TPA: DNA-formamidopyrimidine glycosylase family protein [Solirubrobacteraceae bacterium]|nr:DNA-formamidopyrimidine glycosylase family protein [Solirubrobacteraceae bacterium]